MILITAICLVWLFTKCPFLSFKLHQQKIMTRFHFDFSIYLPHTYGSSLQFSLFFSCIDSQSPTIFLFSFFFFYILIVRRYSTTFCSFFFFHKLKTYTGPLPPFFFHSHNNSKQHHQVVFYFILFFLKRE